MITGVGASVNATPARAAGGDIVLTLNASDVGLNSDGPQHIVSQMQADIAKYGGLGKALKEKLASNPSASSVDTSQWPDFDGTVELTADGKGLAITIPGEEITTAGFWSSIAATLIGAAVGYTVQALCVAGLTSTGAGAATIPLVCGPLAGATTGAITAVIAHAFTGDLGSTQAITDIIIGAVVGLAGGLLWERYLAPWAKANLAGAITKAGTWVTSKVPWVRSWLGSSAANGAQAIGQTFMSPELASLLNAEMAAWGSAAGPALRVMPLGDSITAGVQSSDNNGYRDVLDNALKGTVGDTQVNFVGSQHDGTMLDADHEGHPGWRIDQIASAADCEVPKYQPNVITLLAGTNDANQDFDLSSAPLRIKNLITQALVDSPKAVVVLAKVTPTGKAGLQPRINAFNAALPGIVSDFRAAGKHVLFTDTSDIDVSEGLQNDAHPDDGGYAKLGADFYRGVMEAVNKGWVQKPDPQQPPQCDAPQPPSGTDGPQPPSGTDAPSGATALGSGWRKLSVIAPGMEQSSPVESTVMAEMNGDKRADYVQIRKDGSIRVAINTKAKPGHPVWKNWGGGTGEFAPAGINTTTPFASWIRLADINGDGRDDFLVDIGSLTDGPTLLDAWLNLPGEGGGPSWESIPVQIVPMENAKLSHTRFADVNGDGRDDVLRVGDTGEVHAYFNTWDPETSKVKWTEKLSWAPGVSGATLNNLRFADVDGDNKADYLMVGADGSVHAYLNKGGKDAGGFERHLDFANASNYPREDVQFSDISGDGKADYLVVYKGGAVRAWLNRGGNL